MYCDKSSFILHKVQQEKGIILKSPLRTEEIDRTVLAFMDNNNIYTNRQNYQQKIQRIIDKYTTLYEVTGGCIQKEKSFLYAWQWKNKNGKLTLEEKVVEVKVHNDKMKQIEIKEVIRILRVYFSPTLKWTDQFLVIREKMIELVKKLILTELQSYQCHIYFNIYLLKSVF